MPLTRYNTRVYGHTCRVLRMESPLTKLRDDEANQIGPQKAIGSTPTKKQPPSSHSESFAPILNHASAMGQLNVSQREWRSQSAIVGPSSCLVSLTVRYFFIAYSRLGNMAGTLDALSFPDYSVPSLPTIDSPAANQFSGIAPPLDYNPNSMVTIILSFNSPSPPQRSMHCITSAILV